MASPERPAASEPESLLSFHRPLSYTPAFEQHASLEAIRAHMDEARRRQRAIQNELGWLEGLYLRRTAEKEAGQWP